jgi:hypothetical protein
MRYFLVLLVVAAFSFAADPYTDASPNPGMPGGVAPEAFLDPLDYIDLEALGASAYCVGVGFDGTNLWATDGAEAGGVGDNMIHVIGVDGTLINSVMQNNTSSWGLRDLTWDGTYMYGSESNTVCYYDINVVKQGSYTCAACSPNRAEAWDGTYFYTGSFTNTIYQVTWNGVSGSSATYTTWSTAVANGGTYGCAYDDYNDCFWVSTASYDYQIYQIDTSGSLINAFTYTIEIAGGCSCGDLDGYPGQTQLWVLEQGTPDALHCLWLQTPGALERDTWAGIKTLF